MRDSRYDTRQQPGNPSIFLPQSSLNVNNEIVSYQASVEFDFNQASSDFDLLETAEVIVECDPEHLILEESESLHG